MAVQEPSPAQQELRDAAREIREQVQREIRQAQQQRDEARAARAQAGEATPPIPPIPGVIVQPRAERVLVTGTGTEFPFRGRNEIPPEAVDMANAFFFTVVAIVIGLPLARAFARRMDRKAVPQQIPAEVTAQLGQLAQAVDAIALEVERISEGQRFTTRLLSEQRDAAQQVLPAASDR